MDFEQRLEKAIERGQRRGDARSEAAERQQMSDEECRRLHAQHRLTLSDHIEECMRKLPQHFPGFRFETLVGERGWGVVVSRDDLVLEAGRRSNHYSRLEMVVRPFSSAQILELTAKGTIRNKEVFQRSNFQRLAEVDVTSFVNLIDLWVLEYAELFAASG